MAIIFKPYQARMWKDGHELKYPVIIRPDMREQIPTGESISDANTLTRWLKGNRPKKAKHVKAHNKRQKHFLLHPMP